MNKNLTLLLDYFLPRFCPSCRLKLNSDEKIICNSCLKKIKLADESFIKNEFNRKFAVDKIISDFSSLYIFEQDLPLQDLIHELKYKKRFRNGIYLGMKLAEKIKDKISLWNADYIIPIPLHHLKEAERGYNQSYYIAKKLSREVKIKFYPNLIKRIRYTFSQTTLDAAERKINIEGAFKVSNRHKIKGRNIILLDDVITTGATISECGRVLISAGANKVFTLSVAIADK